MKKRINRWIMLVKNLGLIYASKQFFYYIKKDYASYIGLVEERLSSIMERIIEKYNGCNDGYTSEDNNIIWICWWQGKDCMPELVQLCYKQLIKVTPDNYEVILVSKTNYKDYIDIPVHILDKLNAGVLPITQFSDILRNGLLYTHGGTWIDASIWCSNGFTDFLKNKKSFWSVKLESIYDEAYYGQIISMCKWSSFLMSGCKGNIVNGFVYDCMCAYFDMYDCYIDYFMQNFLIRLAYNKLDAVRNIIDTIEPSNPNIYKLYEYMDQAYDTKLWEEIRRDTCFFKLTQKRVYLSEVNGDLTFYQYLKGGRLN